MKTVIRVSSSIANFHDKLQAYLKLNDWHWWRNRNDRVIFFGLYHWKDYLRFIWHRGPKKTFWCGSDILALEQHPLWLWFYRKQSGQDYCENEVEYEKLWKLGIFSKISPMLFDDPDKYPISYKWQPYPKYFATYHKGRETEYGYGSYERIDFLEGFSPEKFDEKIKEYQGTIRFNEFDGFSENLAKSVLMGQWPASRIWYRYIINFSDPKKLLFFPPKEPNYEASNYWRKTLKENKDEVVNNW